MEDHLSDCSDDSFEIVSHNTCEEPENELISFYKPKVTFREMFDVYPMDSDIVARISLTQDFKKSPEDTVIVMPLAWTSMDQGLCSATISGDYVRFDVNDLPKSSADKFYQLCYCATKDKAIEGVSTPFSFREVHEEELIEFQREQNKEFWTFRSRFAVLMNIYWSSLVENKIFNTANCVAEGSKPADAAASFVERKISANEEKPIHESLRSLSIQDSRPESEVADLSPVIDKGSVNKAESFGEIEKLPNTEDADAEEKKPVDESDSITKREEAVAVVSPVECEEAVAAVASQVECEESTSPHLNYDENMKEHHPPVIPGLFKRIEDLERALYEEKVRYKSLETKLQQREKDYEALENKFAVEGLFDSYSRSDETKRLNERNAVLEAQCRHLSCLISQDSALWEDNCKAARQRVAELEDQCRHLTCVMNQDVAKWEDCIRAQREQIVELEARNADLEAERTASVEQHLVNVMSPLNWGRTSPMHTSSRKLQQELATAETKLAAEIANHKVLEKEVELLRKKEESFAIKLVEITVENQKQLRKSEKIQAELEIRLREGAKEYAKLYLKLQKYFQSPPSDFAN